MRPRRRTSPTENVTDPQELQGQLPKSLQPVLVRFLLLDSNGAYNEAKKRIHARNEVLAFNPRGKSPKLSSSDKTGGKNYEVCHRHGDLPIKFICTNCLKEICDLCILEHKEHITSIKSIYDIIDKNCRELEASDLKAIKKAITHREAESFNKIDYFFDEFYSLLKAKIQAMKRKMLHESSAKINFLDNYPRFKEMAMQVKQNRDMLTPELLDMLKEFVQFEQNPKFSSISVDPNFYTRFDQIISECVLDKENFESGDEGCPKVGSFLNSSSTGSNGRPRSSISTT